MATTNSALITTWGNPPKYTTTPLPPPSPTQYQIRLLATGLHQVVLSRASGKHYTSGPLPHIPGVDGVGTILFLPSSSSTSTSPLQIGQKVYINTLTSGGSFSEILNVPQENVFPLPASENIDAVQIAALVNPAMSSWMAFKTRVDGLTPGFSVLILGATSASGRIAAEISRFLGAGRVIGVARNMEKLAEVAVDERIQLREKIEETDFSTVGHVDVILDYVYGRAAEVLLGGLKTRGRVQYVQVGGLGGRQEMNLPGSVLRAVDLTIRGAGPGAWSFAQLGREIPGMLEAVVGLGRREVKVVQLKDVEERWNDGKSEERVVYVP